ncbi:MAG TPA: hypothetical protein VHQ89_14485 [Gaiellaceae bacterium]|nr:hypothetical protein [Gaiellaceae bacterium]
MGLFRRQETLNRQLMREAGLLPEQQEAQIETATVGAPVPQDSLAGIHGRHRPREADVVVTADAPDIEGDTVQFVTLPDGSLVVENGGDSPLDPLASAVESELRPPYRARAVRQNESLWAIEATRLGVVSLPDAPGGDVLDVTRTDEGTTTSVDGQRIFGTIPALEELGERQGRDFAVHAERLDGDLWEVRAAPL